MMEKLKKKWGITSNWRFAAIFLSFSLAGMGITRCRKFIFHLLHFTPQTPTWIKTVTYIALIPPLYQVLLMFFGTLLGEFRFFWEKEKKMGRWLRRRLLPGFDQ